MDPNFKQYLGLIDPKKMELSNLTYRHKQIILLHLQGMSTTDIEAETGYSISTIRRVLNSDLAKAAIDDFLMFQDQEFTSLYSMAINAFRSGMQPTTELNLRVQTADKYLKHLNRHVKPIEDGPEELVRRIMEIKLVEERTIKSTTPTVPIEVAE